MIEIVTAFLVLCGASGSAVAQGWSSYGGYGSSGQHQTQGYTNHNGTYVQPHMQTNPNGTINDNWSTRGNTNPYTGQPGYVTPRY